MVRPSNWYVFGRTIGRSKRASYTLLECLLALFLVALFSSSILYGWRQFLAHQQMRQEQEHLIRLIQFAQISAMRRGEVVTLCGSDDGKHCDGVWAHGVRVQTDNSQLLRYWRIVNGSVRLSWRGSFGRNHHLKFAPSGFTLGQLGRFYLCANKTELQDSRAIVISASGRQRIETSRRVEQYCRNRS